MRCPYCSAEISSVTERCPRCGLEPHFGGNTVFYDHAVKQTLSLPEILSDVFKKHSHRDLVNSLLRQPGGDDLLSTWRKPWLFLRLFGFLLLLSIALYAAIPNPFAVNLFVSVGCMVVPLSLMVFIWEMDIPSNVSIFDMILLLFFGGILSIIFAGDLNEGISAAFMAAFTEEPSKLLVCVLFIALSRRRFYGLDGLAIGAAVGAGFAFMESIQYVYQHGSTALVVLRGIRAISSHVLYTAPYVGMLTYAMNGRPLRAAHFMDRHFLAVLACGMLAHAVNNAPIQLITLVDTEWMSLDIRDVLKTIFVWTVFLYVARCGVQQVLGIQQAGDAGPSPDVRIPGGAPIRAPQAQTATMPAGAVFRYVLYGQTGEYAQRGITLREGASLIVGRDPARCHICLKLPTISGVHCRIRCMPGGVEVCDLGSKNGTYVNQRRLQPHHAVLMHPGDVLGLHKDQFLLCDRRQG
ncbi:MAG: PrsW family glutamic-type intramembrane protease [Candidatus Ventricola sp.]